MHPIQLNRGAKHWQVINLATIAFVNLFLLGAVAIHLFRVICFTGGIPKGTIGLAMFVAAILQIASLVVMGIVVPLLGTSTQAGTNCLLFQAWIQMVAVLLVAWVCYQRALALRYTKPWIAPAARGLTIAFVLVTVGARIAASVYEIPTFIFGDTPAFSRDSYISIRIGSRLAMNGAAFVFFAFMEVYVTASIIRHRHAPSAMNLTCSQQPPRSAIQNARSMLLDTSSFSARLRTSYATLIFSMNLVQVLLNVINLLITPVLFPLYQAGWALVIVRLFEFRSELETPHPQQQLGSASDVSRWQQSLPTARIHANDTSVRRQLSVRGLRPVPGRRHDEVASSTQPTCR